jgi:predicted nucleotidyltransferase
MVKREIRKIIDRYCFELTRMGIHPERVLLYGSQVKGTAKPDSDIDLIVISQDWEKYSELERLEILGVTAARILEPVQAKAFTPQEISSKQLSTFWEYILHKQASLVS